MTNPDIVIRVRLRDPQTSQDVYEMGVNLCEHLMDTFNEDESLEAAWVEEPRP